jgi:ribosomal protein S18 acetylase RimI-like enzyme
MKTYQVSFLEAIMPYSIRRAVSADVAVLVEFNRLLAEESEGKTLDPAVLFAGVTAGLADPRKSVYFVAEEDGVVHGQIMFTTEWSDWRNGWFWWIQSVYVRPEARRRGVFRALFEHVFAAARMDPEVIGLRLYVEAENHDARETYRRLGMESTSYGVFERHPL